MSYNGWTNWETWNCNLWYDGHFDEDASGLWEDAKHMPDRDQAYIDSLDRLTDIIKDYVQEDLGLNDDKMSGLQWDLVSDGFDSIEFEEIARSYLDSVIEWEERKKLYDQYQFPIDIPVKEVNSHEDAP